MKIEGLHIGMKVRHPQYGVGVVKSISEATADIQFDDGRRTVAPEPSGLEPAEPQASIRGLELPLAQVVQQTVDATIHRLGLEKPDSVVEQLGATWHKGQSGAASRGPCLADQGSAAGNALSQGSDDPESTCACWSRRSTPTRSSATARRSRCSNT